MKQLYFFLFLFFLLVFEGVAFELLPSNLVVGHLLIIPHWIVIFLFLLAIFYDGDTTSYSVIYGIIFGLLIDIVYTSVLGVYMFAYPVTVYIIKELKNLFHTNFLVVFLLGTIGLIFADTMIHIVYSAANITDMNLINYLSNRLLPTVLANVIFLIVMYPIFKNRFIKWKKEQVDKGATF
ncbi:rod shape-determining protein MreD [Virgibacillus sp. W0181]|uniref:rod shape-determining protein MreD n=1 Tax=Virgibacillus sp. W0181 TaxID=3391581 RepID=UPI003F484AD3